MELVEHEKVRLTDRHSKFWYAGLDFMGSGREKVRTKRFYSQKSSSIQPRTNPPKVYSYVCSCPDIGIRISYIYGFFPFPTVSVSFRWVGERDDSDKNSRYRIRKKILGKFVEGFSQRVPSSLLHRADLRGPAASLRVCHGKHLDDRARGVPGLGGLLQRPQAPQQQRRAALRRLRLQRHLAL